jgi:hypothetical protein
VPTTWNNPNVCPFCEMQLDSPGAGFMDHLKSNPACESGFDQWRGNVDNDIRGGWSG